MGRHAGVGLSTGSGGTLDVDLWEIDAKTGIKMADSVGLVDSDDGDSTKIATLTEVQKILGETAAGVAATTGLSEVDGVLTAAIKLAHLVADEKSAIFVETGEFDFGGSADAVDTKVIDAMAAKGQLLFALISVSEVADGTTSAVLSISKAAAAATKMTGDLTITLAETVYQNVIGNCLMMWPVAGADSIAAAAGDVYLYAAASVGRTAGIVNYALVFLKTA